MEYDLLAGGKFGKNVFLVELVQNRIPEGRNWLECDVYTKSVGLKPHQLFVRSRLPLRDT